MKLIGIDCASKANEAAFAVARVRDGRLIVEQVSLGQDDVSLAQGLGPLLVAHLGAEPVLLAFDAPLGWPADLAPALAAHEAGEPLPVQPNILFRRATDRFVEETLGKHPLEVGADLIARTAHAALDLLTAIRAWSGLGIQLAWEPAPVTETAAIEVYPAATLLGRWLSERGYKGHEPQRRSARLALLSRLEHDVEVSPQASTAAADSDHALDAILCALAAADFVRGRVTLPGGGRPEASTIEGWIWFHAGGGPEYRAKLQARGGRRAKSMARTKRQLQLDHAEDILGWLDANNVFRTRFERVGLSLSEFVIRNLVNEDCVRSFVDRLHEVIASCNEQTFEDDLTALSYAHVHMLERYRRTWVALEHLLAVGALPLRARDQELAVLDVGSGPGSCSYAVSDFYDVIDEFAKAYGVLALREPPPSFRIVERGRGWHSFVHHFSESARRDGPFGPSFTDFAEFDPVRDQQEARRRRIRQVADEDDMSDAAAQRWLDENEPGWHENWFFDLCVASYFFTTDELVVGLEGELYRMLRAMRPGGAALVLGASGSSYGRLFDKLDVVARKAHLEIIEIGLERHRHEVDAVVLVHYARVRSRLVEALGVERLREAAERLGKYRFLVEDCTPPTREAKFRVRAYRRGGWPKKKRRASSA